MYFVNHFLVIRMRSSMIQQLKDLKSLEEYGALTTEQFDKNK